MSKRNERFHSSVSLKRPLKKIDVEKSKNILGGRRNSPAVPGGIVKPAPLFPLFIPIDKAFGFQRSRRVSHFGPVTC